MNNEEKLNFIRKEIVGLNAQFLYLNSLMQDKFSKILEVLQAKLIDNR